MAAAMTPAVVMTVAAVGRGRGDRRAGGRACGRAQIVAERAHGHPSRQRTGAGQGRPKRWSANLITRAQAVGDREQHRLSRPLDQLHAAGITIRGYSFPWGTKRIPYSALRAVQKVDLGTFRGRGRMWGTGNPRYWASLDPRRPGKRAGFLLDVGRGVTPLSTPDDPSAVEEGIRARRPEVVASGAVPPPII